MATELPLLTGPLVYLICAAFGGPRRPPVAPLHLKPAGADFAQPIRWGAPALALAALALALAAPVGNLELDPCCGFLRMPRVNAKQIKKEKLS